MCGESGRPSPIDVGLTVEARILGPDGKLGEPVAIGVTEGYVGADIEGVTREAAIMALRDDIKAKKISKKHFEKAMKIVRPSVTKDIIDNYKQLENFFRQAKAKQMQEEKPSYMG